MYKYALKLTKYVCSYALKRKKTSKNEKKTK